MSDKEITPELRDKVRNNLDSILWAIFWRGRDINAMCFEDEIGNYKDQILNLKDPEGNHLLEIRAEDQELPEKTLSGDALNAIEIKGRFPHVSCAIAAALAQQSIHIQQDMLTAGFIKVLKQTPGKQIRNSEVIAK